MDCLTSFYTFMQFFRGKERLKAARMVQEEILGIQTGSCVCRAKSLAAVLRADQQVIRYPTLRDMGVSYFRRQQSCAKVVYKLRSFAGTEHKAPAFETTSRILTSFDFLLDERSGQSSSSPDQNPSECLCLLAGAVLSWLSRLQKSSWPQLSPLQRKFLLRKPEAFPPPHKQVRIMSLVFLPY